MGRSVRNRINKTEKLKNEMWLELDPPRMIKNNWADAWWRDELRTEIDLKGGEKDLYARQITEIQKYKRKNPDHAHASNEWIIERIKEEKTHDRDWIKKLRKERYPTWEKKLECLRAHEEIQVPQFASNVMNDNLKMVEFVGEEPRGTPRP